jgi:hypothetical protein
MRVRGDGSLRRSGSSCSRSNPRITRSASRGGARYWGEPHFARCGALRATPLPRASGSLAISLKIKLVRNYPGRSAQRIEAIPTRLTVAEEILRYPFDLLQAVPTLIPAGLEVWRSVLDVHNSLWNIHHTIQNPMKPT